MAPNSEHESKISFCVELLAKLGGKKKSESIIEMTNGVIVNTKDSGYLDGQSPHISFFRHGHQLLLAYYVKLLIEVVKPRTRTRTRTKANNRSLLLASTAHLGRLIKLNGLVLEQNQERPYTLAALTDLREIVFIRSIRCADRKARHEFSSAYSLNDEGLKYFYSLLVDPNCEDLCGLCDTNFSYFDSSTETVKSFDIAKYLDCGATAHCYLSATDSFVVKKYKTYRYYQQEWEILRAMSERSQHLIRLVGVDERRLSIITEPYGTRQLNEFAFGVDEIVQSFECMRALVANRIVHRDITPRHFLWHVQQGRRTLVLIDFGCAVSNGQPCQFSGSLHFAADSILLLNARNSIYVASFEHDWESLMKMFTMRHGFGDKDLNKLFGLKQFQEIYNFWQDYYLFDQNFKYPGHLDAEINSLQQLDALEKEILANFSISK